MNILPHIYVIYFFVASCTAANRKSSKSPSHTKKSRVATKAGPSRPHIIFLLADDLGFNDVGWHAFGGSRIRTPFMDSLAYNGVRLENYYVQPKCSPTRTSLMTGRYVANMGLQHINFSPSDGLCLPHDDKILPEKLRDLGYSTHAVGKWHLGFSRKSCLPTRRGFDSYLGILTGTANHYNHKRRTKGKGNVPANALYVNESASKMYEGQFCTHVYTKNAVDVINSHDKTKPLFLYVAFEMVHNPPTVPKKYQARFYNIQNRLRRILAGQLYLINEAVRNITGALRRRGLFKNSVIIFTSDNGGKLYQKSSNWPLRGEKGTLWEGGIKSAGFVHSPLLPQFVRGMENKQLIHVSDWLPTLVEGVAGGNLSDMKAPLDGFNLWNSIAKNRRSPRKILLHNIDPLLQTRRWSPVDEFYWGKVDELPFDPRRHAAIRIGKWKLVTGNQGNPVIKLPVESDETLPDSASTTGWMRTIRLYNIESDPGERYNLASAYPDRVKKYLKKLRQLQKASQKPIKAKYRYTPQYVNGSWAPWLDDEK